MKTMIAHCHTPSCTFKVPVQVDDNGEVFTADVMPVNQQEQEDHDEDAAAWGWYYQQLELQRLNLENNFPNTYK